MLEANTTYTLEVEVGNIGAGTASGGFFPLYEFPGHRVEFLAGGMVLDADDNALAIAERAFETFTLMYTVDATHSGLRRALMIRHINLNEVPANNDPNAPFHLEVDFDNVRLPAVSTVPTPPSLGLLAARVLGITARRRAG